MEKQITRCGVIGHRPLRVWGRCPKMSFLNYLKKLFRPLKKIDICHQNPRMYQKIYQQDDDTKFLLLWNSPILLHSRLLNRGTVLIQAQARAALFCDWNRYIFRFHPIFPNSHATLLFLLCLDCWIVSFPQLKDFFCNENLIQVHAQFAHVWRSWHKSSLFFTFFWEERFEKRKKKKTTPTMFGSSLIAFSVFGLVSAPRAGISAMKCATDSPPYGSWEFHCFDGIHCLETDRYVCGSRDICPDESDNDADLCSREVI